MVSDTPALAMAISILPASLKAFSKSLQEVISHLTYSVLVGSGSSGGERSRMKTFAPLEERIFAAAKPIPDAPPDIGLAESFEMDIY